MNERNEECLLARRWLAEKATPGPWSVYDYCVLPTTYSDRTANVLIADCSREHDNDKQTKANASYIAANSPDVVMADIDEILSLRGEVKKLNDLVDIQKAILEKDNEAEKMAWGGEIPSPLPGHRNMTEDEVSEMFANLNCPWCGGSGHVGDCEEADQQVKKKLEHLEKEADWLALVLANVGCGIPLSEYIDEDVNGMSPPAPEHWREAARNAVEKRK